MQPSLRGQSRTSLDCRPRRLLRPLPLSPSSRHRRITPSCRASAVLQVAHHMSLALLSGTSSALMSAPDFIQPDLQMPLLEPSTAQVLEFDRTIPRSGDVVQYIVRAIDDSQQNPALTESRRGSSWSSGGAADLALAITTLPQHLWRSYCCALEAHPLEAKLATGVVGTILGDGLAQWSAQRSSAPQACEEGAQEAELQREGGGQAGRMRYDLQRCSRQVAYSMLIATPLCHVWFNFLDLAISPGAPTSVAAVVTKVAMDQLLMAPLGTALFFVAMKVLEGTPHLVLPTLRSCYLPTLTASYFVWPLAHLINFSLVPASQRILYVNCISVLWTAYMSHMVNSKAEEGGAGSADGRDDAALRAPAGPVLASRKR